MKFSSHCVFFVLLTTVIVHAAAGSLGEVYLDQKNNVHLITSMGMHQQLTTKGNAALLKLSPDNETVAWLVLNTWKEEGDDIPGSEELAIYRKQRQTSIKCTPFIRDYWFPNGGKKIAIDCGGRRFAGREILYDIKTLKIIASFDQADVPLEKRPTCSRDQD